MGRGYRGTDNADEIRAIADANEQIHIFAEAGDDVIRMDFSGDFSTAQPRTAVNGHHVYGGAGADEFHFDNLSNILNSDTRIVGRIDDLNASLDRILVEGTQINLADPQESIRLNDGTKVDVRIVEYDIPNPSGEEALSPQQFLLIGDTIMYAIEGARLDPTSPTGEETHFFEWTGNPDEVETVDFRDQINYIPENAFDPTDIEKRYDAGRLNLTTSDKTTGFISTSLVLEAVTGSKPKQATMWSTLDRETIQSTLAPAMTLSLVDWIVTNYVVILETTRSGGVARTIRSSGIVDGMSSMEEMMTIY
jgi:hypothetical protein